MSSPRIPRCPNVPPVRAHVHGMSVEIVTADGRTIFCSADTAEALAGELARAAGAIRAKSESSRRTACRR